MDYRRLYHEKEYIYGTWIDLSLSDTNKYFFHYRFLYGKAAYPYLGENTYILW